MSIIYVSYIANCSPLSHFAGLQASGELGEDRQDHRVYHHRVVVHSGRLHTGLIVSAGQGIVRSGAGFGFGAGEGTDAGDVAAGEQGKCDMLQCTELCMEGETRISRCQFCIVEIVTIYIVGQSGLIVIAFSHRSLHTPQAFFYYLLLFAAISRNNRFEL